MGLREQILSVRDSGEVNMLDSGSVQAVADSMGFHDLVVFIEDHLCQYLRFILSGDESELEA